MLRQRINYLIAKKAVVAADLLSATPKTLFSVTGVVEAFVVGVIGASVTSLGELTAEVGIAGNTAALLPQIGKAALLSDRIWQSATPANPAAIPAAKMIAAGADIILTTGTANAVLGSIEFYCFWKPVSTDGNVSAA
jgi:hypothetical protein